MWLRRAIFRWLLPAAFLLPLWLFVGWGVFNAGGWAFLWVLFIAVPSVLVGQLVLTMLTRSRPSVRAERAVSWWDVAGYGLWHALTISLGFYDERWWAPVMVLTVLVGVGMIWLQGWQLWREARTPAIILRAHDGSPYIPPVDRASSRTANPDPHEIIVVTESRRSEA